MTHTPAPWFLNKSTYDGKLTNWLICDSKRGSSKPICESYSLHDFSQEEFEDNANLIAAAPDLLAALIEVDNAMQDIDGYAGRRGTWEVVQNAIRKTKGE